MKTTETNNPNLTGYYPELREKVLKLKEIGISLSKFAKTYCDSPRYDAIYRWATDNRPLNNSLVPVVEQGIQNVKDVINSL